MIPARLACTLAAGLLLTGCATRPRPYRAPDASALLESGQRLASAVAASHAAASRARTALAEVEGSSRREGGRIAALPPKLTELLRIAPVELRPIIEAMQVDVSDLQTAHAITEAQIVETQRAQAALATELEKANAAKNEQATAQRSFIAQADHLAARATEENAARVQAEKKLAWYRWHWWGSWIALGLGVLAALVVAFLKFTGRLALKLP